MNGLSPEDKAFVDLARDADAPSDAQRDRVRRGLVVKLGAAAGLTVSATTAASAAASGVAASSVQASLLATSSAFVVKAVAVAVVLAAAGAGTATIYRSAHAPEHPPAGARMIAAPPGTHALAPAPSPSTSASAPTVADSPPAPPVDPVVPPVAARGPRASLSAPLPREALSPSELERETHLIQAGDAALRAGNAAAALAFFDEHARAFPVGVLAEERTAERVLALCALGREVEARDEAARFLRDRPSAPLAAEVRASCGATNPERR